MSATDPPSTRTAMLVGVFLLAVMAFVGAGLMTNGFSNWSSIFARTARAPYVRPTPELEAASRAIGDGIASAIEQYRTDTGLYPVSLDQLMPKYLPKIDPPVTGRCAWQYKQDARLGFTLGYHVGPMYEEDTYIGVSKLWRIVR